MNTSYKTYRIEPQGNWLRYLIEAETPEGKATGIAEFKGEYRIDRKSVVQGKSVDLGGRRIIEKKKKQTNEKKKKKSQFE